MFDGNLDFDMDELMDAFKPFIQLMHVSDMLKKIKKYEADGNLEKAVAERQKLEKYKEKIDFKNIFKEIKNENKR